jgi:hypothetical protein
MQIATVVIVRDSERRKCEVGVGVSVAAAVEVATGVG